nr:hypothetical protein [Lysinibacillus timonensis]
MGQNDGEASGKCFVEGFYGTKRWRWVDEMFRRRVLWDKTMEKG